MINQPNAAFVNSYGISNSKVLVNLLQEKHRQAPLALLNNCSSSWGTSERSGWAVSGSGSLEGVFPLCVMKAPGVTDWIVGANF